MARKSIFVSNTKRLIGRFLVDEGGTTAIEYALIASGIAATIISIVYGLGGTVLTNYFQRIATAMT